MTKTAKALAELNDLIDNGAELPDVDWSVAKKHGIKLTTLMRAYDAQFDRGYGLTFNHDREPIGRKWGN